MTAHLGSKFHGLTWYLRPFPFTCNHIAHITFRLIRKFTRAARHALHGPPLQNTSTIPVKRSSARTLFQSSRSASDISLEPNSLWRMEMTTVLFSLIKTQASTVLLVEIAMERLNLRYHRYILHAGHKRIHSLYNLNPLCLSKSCVVHPLRSTSKDWPT